MAARLFPPIPSLPAPQAPAAFSFADAPFVTLTEGGPIGVAMQYPRRGMENAEPSCFVRRAVFDRLLEAQSRLPGGYSLCVLDAWRPRALQLELYERYALQIVKTFHLEAAPEEVRREKIAAFVSFPSSDRARPPVHTTGGAVDVTLTDAGGAFLPMGTPFDDFTEKASVDYFERYPAAGITENRRILYAAMCAAGFTNLPSEWWHFDYGDAFWAYYTGQAVRYAGCFERSELTVLP